MANFDREGFVHVPEVGNVIGLDCHVKSGTHGLDRNPGQNGKKEHSTSSDRVSPTGARQTQMKGQRYAIT